MQGANEIDNINEIIEAIHKYPWPTDIAPIIIALADKRREDYLEIQRLNEIINDIKKNKNNSWRNIPRSIPNISNKINRIVRYETIQIPTISAGSIMGKKGTIVRQISIDSGAKIIIQNLNLIKTYQKRRGIKIIGNNKQINKAKEIIAKLIGQDSIVARKCFCCGIINCNLINRKNL
jgi:hypothetical protein